MQRTAVFCAVAQVALKCSSQQFAAMAEPELAGGFGGAEQCCDLGEWAVLHARQNQGDAHFNGELQKGSAQALSTQVVMVCARVLGGLCVGICAGMVFFFGHAFQARSLGQGRQHGHNGQSLEPLDGKTDDLSQGPAGGFGGLWYVRVAERLPHNLFRARRVVQKLHGADKQLFSLFAQVGVFDGHRDRRRSLRGKPVPKLGEDHGCFQQGLT